MTEAILENIIRIVNQIDTNGLRGIQNLPSLEIAKRMATGDSVSSLLPITRDTFTSEWFS